MEIVRNGTKQWLAPFFAHLQGFEAHRIVTSFRAEWPQSDSSLIPFAKEEINLDLRQAFGRRRWGSLLRAFVRLFPFCFSVLFLFSTVQQSRSVCHNEE